MALRTAEARFGFGLCNESRIPEHHETKQEMANVQADLARIFATLNPALAQQLPQQLPFPLQPTQLLPPQDPRPIAGVVSPRPDPRTITTLAAANRYVTRHLALDSAILSGIRSLKSWQHAKERSWASGRQELLRRHKERPENEAKLAAFLQSMGQVPKPTVRDEEQELRAYDQTVFEKSKAMVQEMEREMARLGVPLFCEGVEYNVEEATLREWKRRVVELLEDLCEDEGA